MPKEPPAARYQLIVAPAVAVAPKATVPVPQREAGVVPVIVGPVTVIVVVLLVDEHAPEVTTRL